MPASRSVCLLDTCTPHPGPFILTQGQPALRPTAQMPWGLPSRPLGDLHEPFLSCPLFPGSTWAALYFVVLAALPPVFRSLCHRGETGVCLPGPRSCVGIGQGHQDRWSHATRKEKEKGGHDPPEVRPQGWWPTGSQRPCDESPEPPLAWPEPLLAGARLLWAAGPCGVSEHKSRPAQLPAGRVPRSLVRRDGKRQCPFTGQRQQHTFTVVSQPFVTNLLSLLVTCIRKEGVFCRYRVNYCMKRAAQFTGLRVFRVLTKFPHLFCHWEGHCGLGSPGGSSSCRSCCQVPLMGTESLS